MKLLQNKIVGPLNLLTSLAISAATAAYAGSYSTDFDSGLPPDTLVFNWAHWDFFGGVGDSGVVKLTEAFNSQEGSLILPDLDGGAEITGFTAAFKMKIGGGAATPADGVSFNFAPDLPDWSFGEEGAGTGLTISFDTFDNGGGEAPAIDVKRGGTVIASAKGNLNLFRTDDFVNVLVQVSPGGTLNLTVGGTPVFTSLAGAFVASPGRFGFGARTGGFNDNHWIDDLQITTTSAPPEFPFVFSTAPLGTGAHEESIIQVVVRDGVRHVVPGTVLLKLNGAVVPAVVTKVADTTTVTYDPPGFLASGSAQNVSLTFADDGSPATTQTVSYTFQVRYYLGPTGNVYEFILADLTWEDANLDAQTRSYHGRPGHLATLTSYEEDLFANKLRATAFPFTSGWEVWIGGYQTPGAPPPFDWNWVNGEGVISGANGGSTYSNWIPGEPNDYFGFDSENYLTIGLNGTFGWNDSGYFGTAILGGYIIEYEALSIAIDIKPGSSQNVVNVQDQGKIPVAVYSSATFDATTIDVSSVRFGRTGLEASAAGSSIKDVNGDGRLDLQLTFNNQDTAWRCGDSVGFLIARDRSGTPLKGSDAVQLNGCPVYGLAVTALQDVNNKTDVQLTVSPLLPGYTAPTVASQALLRSRKISGEVGWSKSFNSVPLIPDGGSSVGILSFTDLLVGQKIEAKVNVANSKTKQTEVVRGDARVLLRPDLAIGSPALPPTVNTRRIVNISAPITELQGDLDATADAVLFVDGVAVDQVQGLKVAAASQVGVVFATRFQTAGIHQLKIRLQNVNPGDFDYSNNEVSFAIEAVQPAFTSMHYDAYYNHSRQESHREWDDYYSAGTSDYNYVYESFSQYMFVDSAVGFPLEIFSVGLLADGTEKITAVLNDVAGYLNDYGCFKATAASFSLGGNAWAYVESDEDCSGAEGTSIQISNYAWTEMYFSAGYNKFWDQPPQPFQYSYNYGYGTFLDAANAVQSRVIAKGAYGTFGGNAEIPSLTTSVYEYPYDYVWEGGFSRGYDRYTYTSGYNGGTTTEP